MSSLTVREKAERLLVEDRVHVLFMAWQGAAVAVVQGDRGRYLTTVLDPRYVIAAPPGPAGVPASSCTCKAGRELTFCSHVCALALMLERASDQGVAPSSMLAGVPPVVVVEVSQQRDDHPLAAGAPTGHPAGSPGAPPAVEEIGNHRRLALDYLKRQAAAPSPYGAHFPRPKEGR